MTKRVERRTVDLSEFPDLVVIYLGMRVNALTGMKTLLGLGPGILKAAGQQPDGLLSHESFLLSIAPPNIWIRQYWRDFESLERWSRSAPHAIWWKNFLRNSGGTEFWHETYSMRGGIEAIYDDVGTPLGMMRFAPVQPAQGNLFSARQRLQRDGSVHPATPVSENDICK